MAPSSENISRKIKELSRLKIMQNSSACNQNISNIVRNMNLQGTSSRLQNKLRRSVNFLNNNRIITPLGLTMSVPSRRETDEDADDGTGEVLDRGTDDDIDHGVDEDADHGVGNGVDGGHSHLPQSSGGHCNKCCCKKAETSLEKLQQEVNDLKELVKNLRHSNGYQFGDYTLPGNPPSNPPQSPSMIPPPPPPPPPLITISEGSHYDPLRAAREAQRKKKEQILKPVQRGGLDMTEVLKEMKGVTLKQVPRSPGGTPYRSKPRSQENGEDAGNFLARALQKRFDSLASPESSPIKSANSTFDQGPS